MNKKCRFFKLNIRTAQNFLGLKIKLTEKKNVQNFYIIAGDSCCICK